MERWGDFADSWSLPCQARSLSCPRGLANPLGSSGPSDAILLSLPLLGLGPSFSSHRRELLSPCFNMGKLRTGQCHDELGSRPPNAAWHNSEDTGVTTL